MSESPTTATNPRVLIVGNAGQLGRELEKIFTGYGAIVGVDRESIDLADAAQTRELVRHRHDAIFVHYSTDYIFDGGKSEPKSTPWIESDTPNPLNVYGASKLAGEQAVENTGGKFLIFRTSWVYGPHGNNFLLTMLRLARERDRLSIVDDQIGGPTTSIELARATHSIVTGILAGSFGAPEDWTGLYHMTCGGSVSWFGFAQAIFARAAALLALKPPTLTPIATKDYPTPAARPRYSVLSNAKLHARFNVALLPWESALEETLQALRNAG